MGRRVSELECPGVRGPAPEAVVYVRQNDALVNSGAAFHMVTLAAQGFALYCIVVHLMLLIRTAGALDLAATDNGGD